MLTPNDWIQAVLGPQISENIEREEIRVFTSAFIRQAGKRYKTHPLTYLRAEKSSVC